MPLANKPRYALAFIHNHTHPQDFDMDLFSIDKIWVTSEGDVDFAERVFRIRSPHWLLKLVFGPECPNYRGEIDYKHKSSRERADTVDKLVKEMCEGLSISQDFDNMFER